jgi:hypothetical protein
MPVEGPWKKPFDPYAEFEEGLEFERTKLLSIGLLDFEELQNKEKRDYVREYLSDPAKRMKAKSSLKARGYTVADLEEVIQDYENAAYYNTPSLENMSDLVADSSEKLKWVVQDLLPATGVSLLVSPPKLGKSTTARYLAWCVATGTPFLGREIPTPGPVLWVTGDESRAELRHGFDRIFSTCGDPKNIYFLQGYIRKKQYSDVLLKAVMDIQPSLVIIDTFAHAFDMNDINNYGQVQEVLAAFKGKLERLNVGVLFLFHTNKQGDKGEFTGILGSTAIRGATSTNYTLSSAGNCIRLKGELRSVEDVDMILDIDWATGKVFVTDHKPSKKENRTPQLVFDIVQAYFWEHSKWPGKQDVKEHPEMSGTERERQHLIDEAVRMELVEIVKEGKFQRLVIPS